MTHDDFMASVLRTENAEHFVDTVDVRLLHGAIGIVTEGGELMDALKKSMFYGTPVDNPNLVEEMGDLMYYVFLTLNALDVTLDKVMEVNSAKLQVRYPETFTADKAVNRNLQNERKVVESNIRR